MIPRCARKPRWASTEAYRCPWRAMKTAPGRLCNVSGSSRAVADADDHCEDHQQDEARAPAEHRLQHAADHRRHDRRQRLDRAHQRKLAPGAHAGIKVAHHGARQHDGAGAAERLHESASAISARSIASSRNDAAEAVQNQRRHHHRLAAEAVRDRPVKNLADGKAEQITRNGQLHLLRSRHAARGRCRAATARTCPSTAGRARSTTPAAE